MYLVRFGTVLFGVIWTFCIWVHLDIVLYLVTFGTSVFGAIWKVMHLDAFGIAGNPKCIQKLAPLDVFGIFALRPTSRPTDRILIHACI